MGIADSKCLILVAVRNKCSCEYLVPTLALFSSSLTCIQVFENDIPELRCGTLSSASDSEGIAGLKYSAMQNES